MNFIRTTVLIAITAILFYIFGYYYKYEVIYDEGYKACYNELNEEWKIREAYYKRKLQESDRIAGFFVNALCEVGMGVMADCSRSHVYNLLAKAHMDIADSLNAVQGLPPFDRSKGFANEHGRISAPKSMIWGPAWSYASDPDVIGGQKVIHIDTVPALKEDPKAFRLEDPPGSMNYRYVRIDTSYTREIK